MYSDFTVVDGKGYRFDRRQGKKARKQQKRAEHKVGQPHREAAPHRRMYDEEGQPVVQRYIVEGRPLGRQQYAERMAILTGKQVTPTEQAEPTEQVKPTEQVTPTEQAKPAKLAEPTEQAKPTEPAKPTKPIPRHKVVKPLTRGQKKRGKR